MQTHKIILYFCASNSGTFNFFMRRVFTVLLLAVISFTLYAQTPALPKDCDSEVRDHQGNSYRTVLIGQQCWMAENMRCTTSPTGKSWRHSPSYTIYNPEFDSYYVIPQNPQYGILYNWSAAMDFSGNDWFDRPALHNHRGICPVGWHLPTTQEWSTLWETLGGNEVAGAKMKGAKNLWKDPSSVSESSNTFNALPAGQFTEEGQKDVGKTGLFWSSSALDELFAWQCGVFNHKSDSYSCMEYKCYGCSVRCLKD